MTGDANCQLGLLPVLSGDDRMIYNDVRLTVSGEALAEATAAIVTLSAPTVGEVV